MQYLYDSIPYINAIPAFSPSHFTVGWTVAYNNYHRKVRHLYHAMALLELNVICLWNETVLLIAVN